MRATDPRFDRLVGQTLLLPPPILEEGAEFGWVQFLAMGLQGLTGVAEGYMQMETAKQQTKAMKAQAEAAKRIAEMQAQQRAETMRSLTPILGIAVVGGLLVTVLIVKKKRG